MVPASAEYRVPGADDAVIFADIVRSLGRDTNAVRKAMAMLREMAGDDFSHLDQTKAETTAMALLARGGPDLMALGRAVCNAITGTTGCSLPWASSHGRLSPRAMSLNRETGPYWKRYAPDQGCGVTSTARDADMATEGNPSAIRPTDEIVDVLIIGSGASGAAVAWSLAETRMKILCLEQGDWIKPTDFPSNGRDWEARRYADFDISPNRRARGHRLSHQRRQLADEGRKLQRRWGKHDSLHGALPTHAPLRLSREDAGWRGGRLANRLLDAGALFRRERPHDGRGRPGRRSCVSSASAQHATMPLGRSGTRYARALNELGWHWWPSDIAVATTEYDGRAQVYQPRPLHAWLRAGRKGERGHHLLATCAAGRVELRTRCRVREITANEHGMASGVIYYDPNGVERFQPAEMVILAANGIGTPRLLLNSASARFPNGLANSSGLVGKNLMVHPWPQVFGYIDEEMDGDRGPQTVHVEQGILRDRSLARLRAGLYAAIRAAAPAPPTRRSSAWQPAACPGARTITVSIARCSTVACGSASPARTCRRSTTASRWIRC